MPNRRLVILSALAAGFLLFQGNLAQAAKDDKTVAEDCCKKTQGATTAVQSKPKAKAAAKAKAAKKTKPAETK